MRDVHFEKSNSEHNETRSTKKCKKKKCGFGGLKY